MIKKQEVQEAKDKYLKARNQSTTQKRKNGLDWFPLWLDYLQMRHAYKIQERKAFFTKCNLLNQDS